MDIKKLAQESIAAKEFAYTPYSHFRVGARTSYKGWRDIPGMQYRKCRIYTDKLCGEDRFF